MKINQCMIVSLCIVGLTLQASPRAEKIKRIAERTGLRIVDGAIQRRNHVVARFKIVDGIINASVIQAATSPVLSPERVATPLPLGLGLSLTRQQQRAASRYYRCVSPASSVSDSAYYTVLDPDHVSENSRLGRENRNTPPHHNEPVDSPVPYLEDDGYSDDDFEVPPSSQSEKENHNPNIE